MTKTAKIITGLIVVAVAAVGVLLLAQGRDATPTNKSASSDTDSSFPAGVDIVYTGYGFTPDDIAVRPGAKVTIINESSKTLEFASDPHPGDNANPEMNIGSIASGQRKSFTIAAEGLWGYHNDLDPLQRGRIAVLNKAKD
jgi:plastocyanin